MKYLFDTFVAELDGLVGGAEFAAKGRELRATLTEAVLVPPAMLAWLEVTWNALARQSINLYMRLTELARFALTWQFFGAAVAGKSEVAASAEAAKAASRLPKEIRTESFADFTQFLTQKIVGITGGGALAALPAELSKELAQACYPLVHDVRIEARVPPAIWPLADLRVEAIELFDFPGLAAQGTAARDAFLSSRERRENRIHTWVIVVNSGELKGSQATEIVKQLLPDRIVAVANRFDALPIWTDGHIEELERMVEAQAPSRHQEDVLERLELLTPLTTGIFEKLTCPERCVFVSALLGLAELDELSSGNVQGAGAGRRVARCVSASVRRAFP